LGSWLGEARGDGGVSRGAVHVVGGVFGDGKEGCAGVGLGTVVESGGMDTLLSLPWRLLLPA
jgi:hypothetical protein